MPFSRQLDIQHLDPAPRWFVPDHFGITITRRDLLDHGIARVFLKAATIQTVREALDRGISGSGINQHERWFAILAEAAGVFPVDNRTAAEHRPHVVWIQSFTMFLPVNEITAGRMSPVHISPVPSIRVVLEKHVIFAIEEHQPVGVV